MVGLNDGDHVPEMPLLEIIGSVILVPKHSGEIGVKTGYAVAGWLPITTLAEAEDVQFAALVTV